MATKPNEEEDDDRFSTAADEPTAMWTDEMLRDAVGEVAEQVETPPATKPAPAPPAPVTHDTARSHPPLRSGTRRRPPVAAEPPPTLSWSMTFALAIALGTAVYFLVTFLRG